MDHLLSSVTAIIKCGAIRVKKNRTGGDENSLFLTSGRWRRSIPAKAGIHSTNLRKAAL
jgi:hypothetical protein